MGEQLATELDQLWSVAARDFPEMGGNIADADHEFRRRYEECGLAFGGQIYLAAQEKWDQACLGFESILKHATDRLDTAAAALKQVVTNYVEADASLVTRLSPETVSQLGL